MTLADPDATAQDLRSACEQVLALGEHQERLIDALLALASSERGLERREPVDLAEVARQVVLDRRPEAERGGIQVDATLAAAPAAGDARLVESLVANLVDNALRHNVPSGRVEISTAMTAGRASISVRNTGAVIPPDEVERLFQPFQKLGPERISRAGGPASGWLSSMPSPVPMTRRSPSVPGPKAASISRSASPAQVRDRLPRRTC